MYLNMVIGFLHENIALHLLHISLTNECKAVSEEQCPLIVLIAKSCYRIIIGGRAPGYCVGCR